VDRHGVGDGAVAVEEVGLEIAFREREGHRFQFTWWGGFGVTATLGRLGDHW
jgi:hypothetical protein